MCDSMPTLDDFDLDFLSSPPRSKLNTAPNIRDHSVFLPDVKPTICKTSSVIINRNETLLPRFENFKNLNSVREFSNRIAEVDDLVRQVHQLEKERNELQKDLESFRQSATEVRQLYNTEKEQRKVFQMKTEELERKCEKLDTNLETKTLQVDQMQAQLDDCKFPIEYNDLVKHYLKLVKRCKEKLSFNWHDQAILKELASYCEEKGIKMPVIPPRSPRNRKTSMNKQDVGLQCSILQSTPIERPKPPCREQSTQYEKVATRTQGCQHIGTTTTRSTTTSCFFKYHDVGTNCNTLDIEPTWGAILEELRPWHNNMAPISPIADLEINLEKGPKKDLLTQATAPSVSTASIGVNTDSPATLPLSKIKKTKTIGICTYICNVRKPVDFISQSLVIKRSDSRPPSTLLYDSFKFENNLTAASSETSSIPLNSSNHQLPTVPPLLPNAFDELWQIFGHMLYGLLSRRMPNEGPLINENAGINNNVINQQDFYNWLQAFYRQVPNEGPVPHERQTSEQTTSNVDRVSPSRNFCSNSVQQNNLVSPLNFSDEAPTAMNNQGIHMIKEGCLIKPKPQRSNNADMKTDMNNRIVESQSIATSPIRCIASSPISLSVQNSESHNNNNGINEKHKSSAFLPLRKQNSEDFNEIKRTVKLPSPCNIHCVTKKRRTFKGQIIEKRQSRAKLCKINKFENGVEFLAKLNEVREEKSEDKSRKAKIPSEKMKRQRRRSLHLVNQELFGSDSDEERNTKNIGEVVDHKRKALFPKENPDQKLVSCSSLHPIIPKFFDSDEKLKKDTVAHHESKALPKEKSQVLLELNDKTAHFNSQKLFSSDSDEEHSIEKVEHYTETAVWKEKNISVQDRVDRNSIHLIDQRLFGSDSDEEQNMENKTHCKHDSFSKKTESFKGELKSPNETSDSEKSESNEKQNSENVLESLKSPLLLEKNHGLQKLEDQKTIDERHFVDESTSNNFLEEDLNYTSSDSEEKGSFYRDCELKTSFGNKEIDKEKELNHKQNSEGFINTTVENFHEQRLSAEESKEKFKKNLNFDSNEEQLLNKSTKQRNNLLNRIDTVRVNGQYSFKSKECDGEPSLTSPKNIQNIAENPFKNITNEESDLIITCDDIKDEEEIAETKSPQMLFPKRRGRKRKTECLPLLSRSPVPILPCKRSARLLAKNNLKNNESLEIDDGQNTQSQSKRIDEKLKCPAQNPDQIIQSLQVDPSKEQLPQLNLGFFRERGEINDTNETKRKNSEKATTNATFNIEIDFESKSLFQDNDIKEKSLDCKNDLNPSLLTNFIFSTNESSSLSKSTSNKMCLEMSPASPTPMDSAEPTSMETKTIPLKLQANCNLKHPWRRRRHATLLTNLISSYRKISYRSFNSSQLSNDDLTLIRQLRDVIENYFTQTIAEKPTPPTTYHYETTLYLTNKLQSLTQNDRLISHALIASIREIPRPPVETYTNPTNTLPSEFYDSKLNRKFSTQYHQYIYYAVSNLQHQRPEMTNTLLSSIESILFNVENSETISLNAALNLTDFYLLILQQESLQFNPNPARLYIAKCLYYHKAKAPPMVYAVLAAFPTALPHREERRYDRSDPLITVLQHILMGTPYDMNNHEMKHRELLSKLRFEYHFEPFKPDFHEVLTNLIEKLKANKSNNLVYAFALFCKRLNPQRVMREVVQEHLIPISNDYYKLLQQSSDYDAQIATLLDCLSSVIKPFPRDSEAFNILEISNIFNILQRFLYAVERPTVQEAAVQAILRLQRFDHIACYNALANYQPSYDLQPNTYAALKTFVHRKSWKYWYTITANNV